MALDLTPYYQMPYSGTLPATGNGVVINGVTINGSVSNSPLIGSAAAGPSLASVNTPIAPQLVVTFDTIGQTIYSTLGFSKMPLRYLWVQGINNSGDTISADGTITFAAAFCAPLDPLEEGLSLQLFDGAQSIFDTINGITPPSNWDPIKQALLLASLATAVIYPGTEGQDPDPTITADKGASLTSANRGIRYIVLQDYPATSLPQLSGVWQRTNPVSPGIKGKKKKPTTSIAVEFSPGSS